MSVSTLFFPCCQEPSLRKEQRVTPHAITAMVIGIVLGCGAAFLITDRALELVASWQ